MTRSPFILTLVAAAALAGCDNSDHTIIAGPDTDDEIQNATNTPITLPPAIAASKIYRCGDNSVVYVDWLADDKTANVRTEEGGTPTQVAAAEPGKPMTSASGYTLTGTAKGSSISITLPDHGSKSCKA